MSTTSAKDWKYYTGLTLIGLSVAALGVAALAPVLCPPAVAAAGVTAALVAGEVSFWAGAALAGKPAVAALKARVKGWFVSPAPAAERP